MPSSTNPDRVLLFGKDRTMLNTRALVLQSTRLAVDIATDIETFKQRVIDPNTRYGAVICCYTTPESECEEVAAIAARSHLPVLQLDGLVQPISLIAQVTAMLAGQ
jgi:hypothetical protein